MSSNLPSNRVYAWETDYEKSWELLKEDSSGYMQKSINQILEKSKAAGLKKTGDGPPLHRLSMMRHLFLIIDLSEAMKNDQLEAGSDYKPSLVIYCLRALRLFVEKYFDLNPIGQMGIIITRNKRADKLSELCGHPGKHLRAIDRLITACSIVSGGSNTATTIESSSIEEESALVAALGPSGEASLQNALALATRTLSKVPKHTSREILALFASLSTCDPGDIHETVEACVRDNITCSMISLTAEVYVYRTLCTKTGGLFCVAIDGSHLKRILLEGATIVNDGAGQSKTSYLAGSGGGNFLHPPPSATQTEATLVRVGFPRYHTNVGEGNGDTEFASVSACACHIDDNLEVDSPYPFTTHGYLCPICRAKYCELPTECRVCGLTLVSAPHLARSYSHLFPPQDYQPIDLVGPEAKGDLIYTDNDDHYANICKACLFPIGKDATPYQCGKCHFTFCIDCTLFVHSTLHACPGCALTHVTTIMDDSNKC